MLIIAEQTDAASKVKPNKSRITLIRSGNCKICKHSIALFPVREDETFL